MDSEDTNAEDVPTQDVTNNSESTTEAGITEVTPDEETVVEDGEGDIGKRKRTEEGEEGTPPEKRSKSDEENDDMEDNGEEVGSDLEENVGSDLEENVGNDLEENVGNDLEKKVDSEEIPNECGAGERDELEDSQEAGSPKVESVGSPTVESDKTGEKDSSDESNVKMSDEEITEKSEKMEDDSEDLKTSDKDKESQGDDEKCDENDSVKSLESESLKSSKDSVNDKGSEGPEESSSVKSEDSEKENRRTDADTPIDLTTKSGIPNGNGGMDVIMLSDSEEELMNGVLNGDMTDLDECEIHKRRKIVKRLQAELRNEEAKLILLRKMRQSQVSSPSAPEKPQKQPHAQPPPLVRPGQQPYQARPAHNQPPQLIRSNNQGTSSRSHQQGPPPLVNMRGQNMSNGNSLSQQLRFPGMQGQSGSRSIFGSSSQSNQNSIAQVDTQTPAQRQAAAKMALRKQLEKTLLQIPPPKPPPPEMNFVPSLSSTDFIYLLGLEEAVNYIIDANLISKGQKNPDEKMVCNPFTCVQCNTDFTPVWKREKAGSKNVICEHCVTTNQKKALKQEHTNRLKSAFVKALQQEQEIERMQAQEKTSAPSHSSSSPANNSSAAAASSNSSMNLPTNSASYKATTEAIRHHQNFLQAHQAVTAHQAALRMGQPLGLAPFGAPGPFPYQIPFGGAKASDLSSLQRKYLLDMIPPNRWSK
ncbi:transcriptional repressor p66-beta-like isoform X2 [Ostrea edulis]|nr:transcriptional repressor p66-beta-like isoform X2 [Ostrea edulis]